MAANSSFSSLDIFRRHPRCEAIIGYKRPSSRDYVLGPRKVQNWLRWFSFNFRYVHPHVYALAIVRDLLDNHHDKSADLDSHFHKGKNLVKKLTKSNFQVMEEPMTGLFFQLSLPNPESYPFVNFSCQLDFCMEAGDYPPTCKPGH
ncbi:uncharacterized protein VP01_3714g1 [Puccinia sorghi]|uniref:Uncharacterized protein n=1 Tax=Puccinia sorghi TaxID=27349 RepID=A0A0L6UUW2_9BASI|nr:uncharacterized protein VP01_3714g1 [Puccinia sorghi]